MLDKYICTENNFEIESNINNDRHHYSTGQQVESEAIHTSGYKLSLLYNR